MNDPDLTFVDDCVRRIGALFSQRWAQREKAKRIAQGLEN